MSCATNTPSRWIPERPTRRAKQASRGSMRGSCRPLAVARGSLGFFLDDIDQLLDRSGALVQGRLFIRVELDLVHLLDSPGTELYRHSDKEAGDAVLALQVSRAGQHFLLVLEDGLHHFDRR